MPFILRERGDGYYERVGECFVYGIMDGEVLRGTEKGDFREFRVR